MKKSTCSLLAGLLALSALHAQDRPAADPFARNPDQASSSEAPVVQKIVSICVETFSLDISEAAALYHQGLTDPKIYAELTAKVGKGQAKQEAFSVIRTRSGEKALVENISEAIYPTEYDYPYTAPPGDTPVTAAAAPNRSNVTTPAISTSAANSTPPAITAPALPMAFETRNAGLTLEAEAIIGDDGETIDLRIAPERVTLVERSKWGQGGSETEMPVFETQRMTVTTTILSGQPQLLGTPSRPPISKVDPDSANQVWLSFVTANIIGVAKEK